MVCDVERIFLRRAIVMRTVPICLRGRYKAAMRVALVEATSEAHVLRARGWKLFLLLPRMLLSRPPRGGLASQEKLRKHFEMFAGGRWEELLRDSEAQEEAASTLRRRRRRRSDDAEDRRVSKALGLVQMGELFAGRAALEAAELAPGTNATLQQLQDPVRRPPRAREPIPEHLLTEMPVAQFDMEEHRFLQNLRTARKGVAPGPSGMTCEHLRLLLESPRDSHRFFLMAEQLAQGVAPEAAIHAVRVGRLTALRKPDGGVRGILAGDVVRRLIARTMADAVKQAISPYQYALWLRVHLPCASGSDRVGPQCHSRFDRWHWRFRFGQPRCHVAGFPGCLPSSSAFI